jgi:hypothetical protein
MRLVLIAQAALLAVVLPGAAFGQGYPATGVGKPSLTGFPSIGSDTGIGGGSLGGGGVRSGDGFRLSNAQYQRKAALGRREAQAAADRVRAGATLDADEGPRIRGKLRHDLSVWRDQFRVSDEAYLNMRKQWLVDADRLTAAQWAQQRADWFAARDAWVLANRGAAED